MLVLSRKVGESICIAGDIVVTVSRIEGNRVSLALAAPRDVHIVRQELKPFVDEFRPAPNTLTPKIPKAPLANRLHGRGLATDRTMMPPVAPVAAPVSAK